MRPISVKQMAKVIVFAVMALAILAGSYFRVLDSYELETLDLRFILRPQAPVTDKVAIIEIGDDTIKKLGRFPFDRSHHAIITRALSEAGAKAVIFDIFFSEPQKSDGVFEDAVRKAGNVYFPAVLDIDAGRPGALPRASGYAARCLEGLSSAAKGVGHINVIPDIDGKFRRAPAYIRHDGRSPMPYLSLLVACDYLGIPQKDVKFAPGEYLDLGSGIKVPLDERSNIITNYSSKWGRSYCHYSYVDVAQSYLAKIAGEKPNMDLALLKDKVCIIGLTAVGTVDLHPTPFDPLYPAMGMHAEVFNSVVSNRFIRRASPAANFAILIFLSSLVAAVVLKIKPLKGIFYLLSLMAILVLSSMVLFNASGLWIDVAYPLLCMVIVHLSLTLYRYILEWRKRLLMEGELEIARKIQESFLPRSTPSIEGVEVASAMFTARQVGGDLYDFIHFPDGKLGIMIGDVSGKGVPASLFMAMSVGAFRSFALPEAPPEVVLANLNSKLVKESSSNLFVTMFYSVFDLKNKKVIYGSGGHLPVLYLSRSGESSFLDVDEGSPLGLMEGAYSGGRAHFGAGDMFVFYTDGVTEAMNAKADMYGRERLLSVAEKHRSLSAGKMVEEIGADVRHFEPKAMQHDDITVIVVKII